MSEAAQLQSRGIQLFERKKYEDALTIFNQAFEAFQAEGDEAMAAEMRVNIGLTLREMGQSEEAVETMRESLAHFKETGDQLREAKTLGNMALVYAKIDEHDQAETMYREAAIIFKELGEDQMYGDTIMALGDMQFRSGNIVGAVGTFEQAIGHIRNPNQRQKIMKSLLVVKNRMLGQQAIEDSDEDGSGDDTPVSDRRRRRRRKS